MAHYLQLGEVAAARQVAEKALASIAYREEGEKRNVWVAYLNLEAMYGEKRGWGGGTQMIGTGGSVAL